MTDFSFWQGEAAKQGLVLCTSCFEVKVIALMFKDEQDQMWDQCLDCHAAEQTQLQALKVSDQKLSGGDARNA